jgi:hypothetical protein
MSTARAHRDFHPMTEQVSKPLRTFISRPLIFDQWSRLRVFDPEL